ncbi:polyprenyl synthetase family protein [Brachybacterium sp. YJGR34]|uniref:polyprenyl synthetase family protein n=1 Tax=Brachybacterium sp. YJGR34 TaxID=2059911 RepID=UPI000E0C6996|nr:polyprenyl synthetase family protein [Brachybacterium sp. YJGR34]
MSPAESPPAPARLLALDEQLIARVAGVTDEEIARRRRHLEDISPEAATLADALGGYLDGGKLLRPRFCFWGAVAALDAEPSADQLDALARCGAAIELVQAAALMHDDVIDHSPVRRGRPALHVEAAARHRGGALRGSPEDYGIGVAIVLGDLALSWAEQLAAPVTDGGSRSSRAREEFDALRTEVMAGQYLDILHQAGGFDSAPDREQAALSVIRWKTVPYTVQRPVRLGAALMGASDPVLETLGDWAIEVGTAFQLRDDLLSVVGDQDETGKPIGGDIVEGKRTVLLARTEAAADAAGRALLESVVGRSDATPEQITSVHALMRSTGAVASVAEEVRSRAARAQAILERGAGIGDLGRAGLTALAVQATDVDSLPG